MIVQVRKGTIDGKINAIPSKSYAHRIAICNFLAGKDLLVDCGGFLSKDIEATISCLTALKSGANKLYCGESGSTLRFLIPLCACIGGHFELFGRGRLMDRPNDELFSALNGHGVKIEQTDKVKIDGALSGGQFFIRGDISSQYVSGLLMALPTLKEDSEIILTSPLASKPYVDITLEVLSGYGIKIEKTPNGFFVRGGQKYGGNLLPEGDWSNCAFFLALGALFGKVTVSGLNLNSVQADKKILDVLRDAGCLVEAKENAVTVQKSTLNSFVLDAEDCPDLVPIASVIGAFADGMTVISNIERLKIKESDRVESTMAMLKAFGITCATDGHALAIYGRKVKAGRIDSFNDHRIAMASAVLACGAEGVSEIYNAQAVNKSYPNFFEHLKAIGGNVSEV